MEYKLRMKHLKEKGGNNPYYLVLSKENIQYMTGIDLFFSKRSYALLITDEIRPKLFLNELYQEETYDWKGIDTYFYSDFTDYSDKILAMIPANVQLLIDQQMNALQYQKILSLRSDLDVQFSDEIERLRTIKSDYEIKCMRQASLYADTVMAQIEEFIQLPTTELSVNQQIVNLFAQQGVQQLNFSPIIASGKNTVYPHHISREEGINAEDILLIDIGCQYRGYNSDMTRMKLCGEILSEEVKRDYGLLKELQSKCIEKIKPGIYVREVEEFIRNELKRNNLLEYYSHNLGHGIGLSGYEYPFIHKNSDEVFLENMTLTVGPGIYKPNQYGLRLEDVVLVTATHCESLNRHTKEIQKILI